MEKVFGELKRNAPAEDCILRVTGYSGRGFQDASFTLRRGEVIGFYGLVGAGRTELMRGIFGADEISGGQLELNGECLRFTSPGQGGEKGSCLFDRGSEGSGNIFPAGRAGEYQRRQSEEIEKPVVSQQSEGKSVCPGAM